jgi:putative ABC transport system permease protein
MSLWRQLTRGLRVLTNRTVADRDVADEVQHFLDQLTDAWIARGLTPEAARRAAGVELGNTTVVREQVRAYGWENVVGTVLADLRFAARRLGGRPGFTAVSVVTLALGIGASTAIFSAINPILFEALPYPRAHRIAMISDVGVSRAPLDVTFGTYREVAERTRTFETLAVTRPWQPTVTGAAHPERIDGQRVSADFFRVLGVPPAIGRDFTASDDRLNGPQVVIISDALWRRRFSADDSIAGREIRLNDNVYSVIGVMPRAFENVLSPSADVWTPLQYDSTLSDFQGREWGHHLRMAGRLEAGAGIDRAARELELIAQSPVPEFSRPPWCSLSQGLIVRALQDELTRGVRSALLAVLGAVMLVLVIACVNVTNLLLARGAERRGEFAMRAALGAARLRLIRQMLTESLLLATLGGGLGMVVAQVGIQALVALSPAGLPRVGEIGFDGRVFAFSLVVTTLIGLLVGLIPALQATRNDLHGGVQESARRTAGGHQLARRALVVVEVALALVLLVGSGLLLRSLQRLFAITPGFQPANVLTMQVQTSGHRFDDDRVRHQFFEQALEAVRHVPGVDVAGFTSQLPLSGDWSVYGVRFQSSPTQAPESDEDRGAFRYAVSPGYIEALGIPVRTGRSLSARDAAGAPPVALINESFAKRRFPAHDALGQRLQIGDNSGPWLTVVGIVGDVKQMSLALDQTDAVYVPDVQAR